jgi:signal transduction histidine kinase
MKAMEKLTNGILFLSIECESTTLPKELLIRDSNAFFYPGDKLAGKNLEQLLPKDGRRIKKYVLDYMNREDFEFELFLHDLDQFFRISGYRSGEKNLVLIFTEIASLSHSGIANSQNFYECSDETYQINQTGPTSGRIAEQADENMGTMEDIKRLLSELKVAEEKARRSDAIITSFLTNLSHEIRTPLNGIIGFSQYLRSVVQQKDSTDEYFNIIINNGYRLLQLINDLLFYSKLNSGYVNIMPESCNLNSELDQVISQLYSQKVKLRTGELTINKSYEFEKGKDHVVLDGYNLKEVLKRLLDNAVKYTTEGSVELAYKRKSRNMLLFTVKDTGIGIPSKIENRIFDEFIQAGELYKRKFGGVGIGLVIAKKLVNYLGGEIGFESSEGKGSCFYFSIPFQRETGQVISYESEKRKKESPKKKDF